MCHVDVYSDDPAKIFEYDTCSFNSAEMRRAPVSFRNGDGLVAVYREASDRPSTSLLIEPLVKNRFFVETTPKGNAQVEQGVDDSSN